MRVLAAEDNFITRLDLREILEAAGHHVCAEARDGIEAVELARREQPDIAFLDFSMPGLDGLEAAKRIIEERSIPVVMVTGRRHADLVSAAAAAGVGGSFLAKPFAEADVLAAVAEAEKLHRKRLKRGKRGGVLARLLSAPGRR